MEQLLTWDLSKAKWVKCSHILATVGIYQVTWLQQKCRTHILVLGAQLSLGVQSSSWHQTCSVYHGHYLSFLCKPNVANTSLKANSCMCSAILLSLERLWRKGAPCLGPDPKTPSGPNISLKNFHLAKRPKWQEVNHPSVRTSNQWPPLTFILVILKVHVIPPVKRSSGCPDLDLVSRDVGTNVPHWDGWKCQTLEDWTQQNWRCCRTIGDFLLLEIDLLDFRIQNKNIQKPEIQLFPLNADLYRMSFNLRVPNSVT